MPLVYAAPDSESQFAFDVLEDSSYGQMRGRGRGRGRGRRGRGRRQISRAQLIRRCRRLLAQGQRAAGPQLFSNDPLATGFEASSFPTQSNQAALVQDYEGYGAWPSYTLTQAPVRLAYGVEPTIGAPPNGIVVERETLAERRERLREEAAQRREEAAQRRDARRENRAERRARGARQARQAARHEAQAQRQAARAQRQAARWRAEAQAGAAGAGRWWGQRWGRQQEDSWLRRFFTRRFEDKAQRKAQRKARQRRTPRLRPPDRMVRQQGPTWPPQGWTPPAGVESGYPVEGAVAAEGSAVDGTDWGKILLYGGLAVGGLLAVRAFAGKKTRKKASPKKASPKGTLAFPAGA